MNKDIGILVMLLVIINGAVFASLLFSKSNINNFVDEIQTKLRFHDCMEMPHADSIMAIDADHRMTWYMTCNDFSNMTEEELNEFRNFNP